MQDQLVQPSIVKFLWPSLQEVPKHMWEEAEGWMNRSGNPLAPGLVLGFPQLPCLSPAGEHAVDCLKQKLVSRQPIQPKAKDHVKPQPLKINTNFHSGCDNPNYSMITSLSTSLIPVFALSVRLADSSLLHCPRQRRQKLCPVTVQKIYSHNHFPWYVWNMKLK